MLAAIWLIHADEHAVVTLVLIQSIRGDTAVDQVSVDAACSKILDYPVIICIAFGEQKLYTLFRVLLLPRWCGRHKP